VPSSWRRPRPTATRSNAGITVFHVGPRRAPRPDPPALIDLDVVLRKTDVGNSLLHEAAKTGLLDRIPRVFLTRKTSRRKTSAAKRSLHVAPSTATSTSSRPRCSPWRRCAKPRARRHRLPRAASPDTSSDPGRAAHVRTTWWSRPRRASRDPTPRESASSTKSRPRNSRTQLLLTRNDNGDTPLHAAA